MEHPEPPPEVDQDGRLDAYLAQIVDSDAFRKAPSLRALLLFLWQHRKGPISEYAIAVDALGRPADFDPATDATVRVNISRLRGKIREFYEGANASFPLRITLPKGTYEVQWSLLPVQPDAAPDAAQIPVARPDYRLIACVALLAALCGILFWRNSQLRSYGSGAVYPPLPEIWKTIVGNGKRTTIVISSPIYFLWPSRSIFVRDLNVTSYSAWPSSPVLKDLAAKWGPPALTQPYVGAVEMGSAISMLQYLERRGHPVDVVESAKFATTSFSAQNTITIGMPRNSAFVNPLLEKTNFYLSHLEPDVVTSRKPAVGEKSEYLQTTFGPEHVISPEVITLLPTSPQGTRTLILMGRWSNGVSDELLTADGIRDIETAWKKAGSPDGWEMVLQAEIFRDVVMKVSPVAFRTIPASYWQ